MIAKLREAIERIAQIEETIEVTDAKFPTKIARAYRYWPDANDGLELPCFFNSWAFVSERRLPNAQRELRWVVRTQLLVAESAVERAANSELSTAFAEAYIDAFDRHVQLNGLTGALQNLRPNDGVYQPAVMTWANVPYVGIDFLIDVLTLDVTNIGG